jgi:hypothetical protein
VANDELKVRVRAEVDRAVRDLQRVDSSMQGTSKAASNAAVGFGKMAAAVGAAALVIRGVVNASRELIDAYATQERAEAKLAGVLKATGQAAGYNARQLEAMASSLQSVTTFGDEAILNLQSVLLTFKSIQGEALERTTELALDLSAAFDQDLKSSALQLGKALEDPTIGLTALRRVGVSFTQAQTDMIKAMVEAGDVAAAQAEILDTLEEQVGGVARTMAETKTGGLEQLNNIVGDLRENFGFLVLEAIDPAIEAFTTLAEKANDLFSNLRQRREDASVLDDAFSGFGDLEDYTRALELQEAKLDETRQLIADSGERIKEMSADEWALDEHIVMERNQRAQLIQLLSEQQAAYDYLYSVQQSLAEEAEAQAELERQAAAAAEKRRQEEKERLRIEGEYKEAYQEVLRLLESEKSEREKILDQIEYLNRFQWAAGSLPEERRLEAIELLQLRLEELSETQQLDLTGFAEELETRLSLVGTYDKIQARLDSRYEKLLQKRRMEKAEVDAIVAAIEAMTRAQQEYEQSQSDSLENARIQEAEVQAIVAAYEYMTEVMEETEAAGVEAAETVRDEWVEAAMDIAATLSSQIGAALSGAEIQAREIVRSLVVIGVEAAGQSSGVPGLGTVAGAGFDLLAGIYDWLFGPSQEALEAAAAQARGFTVELDDAYRSEIEIRNDYLDELQDIFDLEFDVLRDQWERNRISTEEFVSGMEDLNEDYGEAEDTAEAKAAEEAKQDLEDARADKIAALEAAREKLQEEWDAMGWWGRLWSGRDEELQAAIDVYDARIAAAEQATTLQGVQSAARGANFVTNGPELLLVGDNPGGREHVVVDPAPTGAGGLTININAPVYGVDDLYEKLSAAEQRLQRRGIVA